MHELPVTQSILEIACRHAEQAGAKQVTDIHLVIGKLSSIVDDSVQFYWDTISAGTVCEGATLHFRRIATKLKCEDCSHEFTLVADLIPCPNCASMHLTVLEGTEFYLDYISVPDDED